MQSMIPVVLIAILLSVSFHSCQKDESVLNASPASNVIENGQLKSASISVVLIDKLISAISGFVISGDLESGIANALIAKLENTKRSIEKGNESAAINQFQAVANQVEVLVGAGKINTTIGEGIIFDVKALAGENPMFTDPRDNREYKTVKIGNQIWMAENLAYLPSVSPHSEESYTEPYYYVYGYEGTSVSEAKATDNYNTYGVLYNWPAAMNGATSSNTNPSGVQGICPTGWHLPSDAEWTELSNYLINNGYNYDGTTTGNKIAKALAATTNWVASSYLGTATFGMPGYDLLSNNSSGFSGLPGGYRVNNGSFYDIGIGGHGWSCTENTADTAWLMSLYYHYTSFVRNEFNKAYGFSVRCVRD